MTEKELYIGSQTDPLYYFSNNGIISIDGEIAVALVGQELCPDVIEAVVKYDVLTPETLKEHGGSILKDSDSKVLHGSQNNDIRTLPYCTPIWYYSDNVLIGKFYSTHVERLTKDTYRINAQSIIGVLDGETYYGNYIKSSTTTFDDWVRDIILTDGLSNRYPVEYVAANVPSYSDDNAIYMTDRVKFKIKLTELAYGGGSRDLSARVGIFGVTAKSATTRSTWPDDIDYGIYAEATRESSSSTTWTLGAAYFVYNGTTYSIGAININDVIVVDINPSAGTATINGTTYTITASQYTGTLRYYYYGRGIQLKYDSTYGYLPDGSMVYPEEDVYYYDVLKSDGTTRRKIRPVTYDFKREKAYLVDVYSVGGQFSYPTTDCGDIIDIEEQWVGCAYPSDAQWELYDSIEYEDGIDSISVYNAEIPVCTKREALYQLIFANGINIIRGTEGGFLFTYMKSYTPIEIADNDIYRGGSVDYLSDVYKIELTEHFWYIKSDASTTTVFDNSNGTALDREIAIFNQSEPVHTPTSSTMKIFRNNAFAAVVSGQGTITGYVYEHGENVITRLINEYPDGETVSITDCTMVNTSNSEVIADRLYAYYTATEKVSNEIKLTNQFCGRYYSFTNPFNEAKSGYLQKMDIKVSNVLKAACEFICGYIPSSEGQSYSNGVVLTGSGTWTVPASVFEKETPRIKVTLISGGQGGESGLAGEDGDDTSASWSASTQASGGEGGASGSGGRVYTVTITNPAASYAYDCGDGGAGGAICYSTTDHNTGTDGEDTTFGSYSTSLGTPIANGVTNFFNGEKYAMGTSEAGTDGGNGGYLGMDDDDRVWYYSGNSIFYSYGSGYYYNTAGTYGTDVYVSDGVLATGGMGGGAAVGANGSNGGNATSSKAGDGGNGANSTTVPTLPTASFSYRHGWGGKGGHGGGAGGSSGTGSAYISVQAGTGGSGGYGGAGGKGAAGCILIYY